MTIQYIVYIHGVSNMIQKQKDKVPNGSQKTHHKQKK